MSTLTVSLSILALLVVMLWFTIGTQRNIRRGNEVMRWLQNGLPLLGKRTTLRWLGSSAVELTISAPKQPFREAQVVVVLQPRDVAWLWAWARSRGRRDFLILRGWLSRVPGFELEAGNAAGWTGTDRLDRLDPEAWEPAPWDQPDVRAVHSPGAAAKSAEVRFLWDRLGEVSGGVWRLSVRRESPHVEVHVLPPDPGHPGSDRLIGAFADLARMASAS